MELMGMAVSSLAVPSQLSSRDTHPVLLEVPESCPVPSLSLLLITDVSIPGTVTEISCGWWGDLRDVAPNPSFFCDFPSIQEFESGTGTASGHELAATHR